MKHNVEVEIAPTERGCSFTSEPPPNTMDMARGEGNDTSDVDLLVYLPPERMGLALGGLLMDVQDLLQRRVEVVTEKSLHPAIRDHVLKEAQPL